MPYTKVNWADGVTPENAANLGRMDQGIADAHALVPSAIPAVVNGQWLKGSGGAMVWSAIAQSDVTGLSTALTAKEDKANKGVANGYAPLDATTKVPAANLPAMSGAALSYDGDWAAGTYQDGQVVVKDGIAYICVGGPTTTAPDPVPWGGAVAPQTYAAFFANLVGPFGTAVPTASDGQPFSVSATGDYLITVAATAYNPATGMTQIEVYVDGILVTTLNLYMSAAMSHLAGIPKSVLLNLTTGTHRVAFRAIGTTGSDSGDLGWFQGVPWLSATILGGGSPVNYATTLPASPVDGQEAILVDSVTNPTYQWRFRYNAASSSAYKWEFMGGAPARSDVQTQENYSSTSYGNLATVGPTFTLPRAGDYLIDFNAEMFHSSTSPMYVALKRGAATESDNDAAIAQGAANYSFTGRRSIFVAAAAAADVMLLRYKTGAATASFRKREMRVTPVRVA